MPEHYWQAKKVAVTGSSGFLGRHFTTTLSQLGTEVIPVAHTSVDLLDYDQTASALRSANIVINCAAVDGNAEFKARYPAKIFDSNIKIASNILNACRNLGVDDVVMISSSEVYSPKAPSPIKEVHDYRQYNSHSSNGYVLSKEFGEILATLLSQQCGVRTYLPRPSNIYGPADHFGSQNSRVIPTFIERISNREPITIWGDGTQTRQFTYVSDVVNAILTMVEKQQTGPLNISTSETISIQELANLIYKRFALEPDIILDTNKPQGPSCRILDSSKVEELIGFKFLSLRLGIQKTVNWFLESKT